MSLHLFLLVLAAVLFFVAIFPNVPAKFNLIAAGLFCWVLTLLV